jgi:hypothetical protein
MRYLYTYADYLIFESVEYPKLLMDLNSVVDATIANGLDAQAATKEIKNYIDSNKQQIVNELGKPDFTRALLTILNKWSDQYGNELDSFEFDYVIDQGKDSEDISDDEFDLPSDTDEFQELDF